MHPTEYIEFFIIGVLIVCVVTLAFFLKGKWRKTAWLLAGGIFVAYCIFLVARPYWIDAKIERKVDLLVSHLEAQYPDEEWTISTVPHRTAGFKHLNPYYIGVIFENEPEATYHYWVESEDDIYQVGYTTNKRIDELMFFEEGD